MTTKALAGKVALVAGATRGCGRGIAVSLGEAGATVYCTGRTTRNQRSPINRAETIEDTAEMVTAAGGQGIAVQVDHSDSAQVQALIQRIDAEQSGQLDIVVNDIWGGETAVVWGQKFWEGDIHKNLNLLHNSIDTHLITSFYAAPLLVARGQGLIIEVTDGDTLNYRGHSIYDLIKTSVMRIAVGMHEDLKDHGVTALTVTPGFLRSEQMLDHFGVAEENWRDAIAKEPHYSESETPYYLGRGIVALASDPNVAQKAGKTWASWTLMEEYGFFDVDGRQPHWGAYYANVLEQAAQG
ncbi:SDR family oxidoreductase [Herpetosiphon giganteus]|uniref:SDR family oxidoreductase n=1 Tax=Herpetosiphon giganteus TaxID=2029754 RepID=UPI00195D477F